jgi:poly(3-hydroxybutyrate) depolymerase
MIYQAYQAHVDALKPLRGFAWGALRLLDPPVSCLFDAPWLRHLVGIYETAALGLSHQRPAFGIDTVAVAGREVAVRETAVHRTPFCTLLRFEKDLAASQPRVLLIAPMSGHFATLLRDTVRTMAAVAIMAEDAHRALPRSVTLMAGPIDARVSPTEVNKLATAHPIEWFAGRLIDLVPDRFLGARRLVYPGFLQLAAFMSMNPERHLKSFHDLYNHRVKGEREQAEALRKFYAEYFAVMDLPAEFYLQTISAVFQQHLLARGELRWRGRRVDPGAIRRTPLLTIEGEKDDICAVGQTLAAHELCCNLRPYLKKHYIQTGVGHYGVFSGRRWSGQIYPIVRNLIESSR